MQPRCHTFHLRGRLLFIIMWHDKIDLFRNRLPDDLIMLDINCGHLTFAARILLVTTPAILLYLGTFCTALYHFTLLFIKRDAFHSKILG